MNPGKINIEEAFEGFIEPWSPRMVAEANGRAVKLMRCKGAFIWHSNTLVDEIFYVVKGVFTVWFRECQVELRTGELILIPKGVERCPFAMNEAWVMVFEPNKER